MIMYVLYNRRHSVNGGGEYSVVTKFNRKWKCPKIEYNVISKTWNEICCSKGSTAEPNYLTQWYRGRLTESRKSLQDEII